MLNSRLLSLILLLLPCSAFATLVDLNTWQSDTPSNWSQTSNGAHVITNADPSALFSGSNNLNSVLSGRFGVMDFNDDDFIGFALGLQPGELTSTSADYWLIDWKQRTQSFGSQLFPQGLSISHVTNGSNGNNAAWSHGVGFEELQRGTNLGSTGWSDNVWYDFSLSYTADLIQFSINGLTEISLTASEAGVTGFGGGSFGLYANSQQNASFADLSLTQLPGSQATAVPSPATHVLMGLGLLSLAAFRKKRVRRH
ncbi:hypothetical protein KOI40_02560 [Aestuariicella sp. G3-2]|uniref:PEP-CTERM sorting domain-containing protein n=1 Tax=Pseudomaricurvus albidus TaxID=2842452 RepID=UPI001C0DED72|nr:PEP-CTERM sorting domain-containing protein [Aestuariicella albida]MBU3068682.1 hypothetical protein [Aestuariicella albida]